jgi:hypothetical protein
MRAIKQILLKFSTDQNSVNPLNDFLNDELTGEIYDFRIITELSGYGSNMFLYTFIYEKLEIDDIENKAKVNQRKLTEIKKSKSKPKLL